MTDPPPKRRQSRLGKSRLPPAAERLANDQSSDDSPQSRTKIRPRAHATGAPTDHALLDVLDKSGITSSFSSEEEYGPEWEQPGSEGPIRSTFFILFSVIALIGCLLLAIPLFRSMMDPKEPGGPGSSIHLPAEILEPINDPAVWAKSNTMAADFLSESDPLKRLQYVRNPEEIRTRLEQFPEQALSEPSARFIEIPYIYRGNLTYKRFAVTFDNGERRLLALVQTEEGPKVDWDCFARYCSASWDELAKAQVEDAEIRVFAREDSYYNHEFADQTKWSCYALSSPDSPVTLFTYLPLKSPGDLKLKKAINSTDKNQASSRFTLRVSTDSQQPERRILAIREILAIGWVKPE
jgi:hypothetical protein